MGGKLAMTNMDNFLKDYCYNKGQKWGWKWEKMSCFLNMGENVTSLNIDWNDLVERMI